MKGQQGFTLIELLVVISITGLIGSFLGSAVYQMFTVTEYGNSKMAAIHDLQNTANWLNRDGQMASAATGGSQLVLTMPDDSTISYKLIGTELKRSDGISQITVAWNITSATFTVSGRTVTLDITSAPVGRQDASHQATYQVYLRPEDDSDDGTVTLDITSAPVEVQDATPAEELSDTAHDRRRRD
jgi:prepilin-type N-terminal cleavage/methylation domain-containing protein